RAPGASKDDCVSKLFTAGGECCRLCNVGEGVVQPCGLNQTVCEPCLDSDCRACRVCEVGFGLMFPCKDSQDTVCEECPEGTFSSEANFVDPCLPCTTCEDNEVLVRECTAVADAECRARGGSDNLIPVYCSILAAVVVGLVAYIAFKRWNSCKQNKQGANNRPVNQTPSPEGEKLHSDSGISVDSQSLHEQQPPGQGTQGPGKHNPNGKPREETALKEIPDGFCAGNDG
ncbi:tumor necrosis factor receptor superfamily member 16, partial [Geospiza fortis]|uniref:Tumor necrosis factor receptor superfamily member 16 n=1 Tax=Geospiza fortis TaxID=48883 RepID=A0A8N5F041_GEOFO